MIPTFLWFYYRQEVSDIDNRTSINFHIVPLSGLCYLYGHMPSVVPYLCLLSQVAGSGSSRTW